MKKIIILILGILIIAIIVTGIYLVRKPRVFTSREECLSACGDKGYSYGSCIGDFIKVMKAKDPSGGYTDIGSCSSSISACSEEECRCYCW